MALSGYFQHFDLKHRTLAFLSQRFRGRVYTVRHGLIRGMKKKGGLGWLPALRSQDETPETRLFQSLDLAGKVVYDVGGFEGVLSMFFSRRAACVITYEANPSNALLIRENLALNHIENVTLRETGAGDSEEDVVLSYDPLMPGAGSADPALRRQYQENAHNAKSFTIHVVPLDLDRDRHQLPKPDFVKIDVEGMELNVLRGLRRTIQAHKPELYLEMHGATIEEKDRKVSEIVAFLEEEKYSSILHVESGTQIHSGNASVARQGHLHCR